MANKRNVGTLNKYGQFIGSRAFMIPNDAGVERWVYHMECMHCRSLYFSGHTALDSRRCPSCVSSEHGGGSKSFAIPAGCAVMPNMSKAPAHLAGVTPRATAATETEFKRVPPTDTKPKRTSDASMVKPPAGTGEQPSLGAAGSPPIEAEVKVTRKPSPPAPPLVHVQKSPAAKRPVITMKHEEFKELSPRQIAALLRTDENQLSVKPLSEADLDDIAADARKMYLEQRGDPFQSWTECHAATRHVWRGVALFIQGRVLNN